VAEIVSLSEAVGRAVADGDAVAMEGSTHMIPFFTHGTPGASPDG